MDVQFEQVSEVAICVLTLLVALHYLRHTPQELRRISAAYRISANSAVGRFCKARQVISLLLAVLFGSAALACPVLYLYHTAESVLVAMTHAT